MIQLNYYKDALWAAHVKISAEQKTALAWGK